MELRPGTDSLAMERGGISSWLATQLYLWRIRWSLTAGKLRWFVLEVANHPSALIGGVVMILYIAMALLAPRLAPQSPYTGELSVRLLSPAWISGNWRYILGCDEVGRDLLSRIIYGSRVSLVVGFLAVTFSLVMGTGLGLVAGYFQGWFDSVLSRLSDLLLAFPYLVFAIFVMAAIGPGMTNLILALSFKGWVEFYRLVRGQVLAEKNKEYVEAARLSGQSDWAILLCEILPNIQPSLIVLATLRLAHMIVTEASLSFLGLGVEPRIPAWGSMVNAGRDYMLSAWWVSTFPGIAIMLLAMATNLFGEGLRDILDPRLKVE
jgi:peptide/nickel transport system permease protein